jgi:hypothetical protein
MCFTDSLSECEGRGKVVRIFMTAEIDKCKVTEILILTDRSLNTPVWYDPARSAFDVARTLDGVLFACATTIMHVIKYVRSFFFFVNSAL